MALGSGSAVRAAEQPLDADERDQRGSLGLRTGGWAPSYAAERGLGTACTGAGPTFLHAMKLVKAMRACPPASRVLLTSQVCQLFFLLSVELSSVLL
jgi:hypothetical protein